MGKKFLTKKVKNLLIAGLCLTVLVTLITALAQGVTLGGNLVGTLLSPFRAGLAAVDRGAEAVYGYLFRYDSLKAENEALKKQLAEAETASLTAERYEREIRRLENLLELKQEHRSYQLASANVISWSTSVWQQTLTIDRGTRDGLQEGLCAVTDTGYVVGVITECGANWSTIATVFDEGQAIAAALADNGATGVVQCVQLVGGAKQLELDYLPVDTEVPDGGAVVTSGSIYYPGGLMIGKVVSSQADAGGVWRYAVLETPVEAGQLEQVFILLDQG
ncbi:MAG: rod shape-determining protein MreC [Oscillospiraceae bacterium]|nr:rod shape-determining protein MreC [Oscillospiraceae bacterium]